VKLKSLLLSALLLVLWEPLVAEGFPIKIPSRGDPPPQFAEVFPIGTIEIDPNTLDVGDTFVFEFNLPPRTPLNVAFITENRGLPEFLSASNTDEIPFPVQNMDTANQITYTVITKPKVEETIFVQVWGRMDSRAFPLGVGLTRIHLVKCAGK